MIVAAIIGSSELSTQPGLALACRVGALTAGFEIEYIIGKIAFRVD
jgi:hypothetical protein